MTSFRCFLRLPTELRIRAWKLTVEPRILYVRTVYEEDPAAGSMRQLARLLSSTPVLAVLYAPDTPDTPKDDPANGMRYYDFLNSLKAHFGSSKAVSFAIPASLWYFKAFPIHLKARDLDYLIYMTYDLNDSWDYGNEWTSSGLQPGNCLRFHINETETRDALAIIIKADAPSNKVIVGVASYGRSFRMT